MKYCANCGLQVAQEVTACPRCGALMPPAQQFNYQSQLPQYNPPAQPPLYFTPPPAVPYGQPLQPPPFPPQKQVEQSRGLPRGVAVLAIVLALLVMFGGFGLIYYTTVAHPAQLRAQATAAVQTILTNDARSTAIANTQATGTAVANANATSTAQAQATVQAQATATAFQNIYTQATQGAPTLNSPLASQDGYNWDVYNTTDGGGCGFAGGALHATLFAQHFYVPCFAHAANFSNFAFQVQMTINKGDEGGLIFRADSANSKFYIFRVSHDGSYGLYVSKDSTHNVSIAADNTSAIKTTLGQPNLLTVVARGSNIYLYINKQYVGSASDGTYSSGGIGVFASDNTANTDAAFSNARVWTL